MGIQLSEINTLKYMWCMYYNILDSQLSYRIIRFGMICFAALFGENDLGDIYVLCGFVIRLTSHCG